MAKIAYLINADWYFKLHWIARAKKLQSEGHHITVITPFTDPNIKVYLQSLGFDCVDVPLNRKSLSLLTEWRSLLAMRQALKGLDPDFIHCITIKPNLYGGLLNLFLKKKILFSITGLGVIFSDPNRRWHRRIVLSLYRLIGRQAHSHFLFENHDDFALFQQEKVLREEQGLVINGAGVDTQVYSVTPMPKTKSVLFAARLLRDKGLPLLIEAFRVLHQQGRMDIRLSVAGIVDHGAHNAIALSDVETWHELGLCDWLGERADMPTLIGQHDLVCLPTQYGEGVPRILIEAAACGRGIVASNVTGCRDIVDDGVNGVLLSLLIPELLAKTIRDLVDDPDRLQAFGQAGRDKVEAQFSDDIVLEKYQRLVHRILS